jgi:hypothetical protein
MQIPWAIHGQANQEVPFMQELAPGLVEVRAVRLEIVLAPDMGRTIFPLKLDHLPEEVDAQQGRLAALPGKDHFLVVLAFKVLSDEGFKHFFGYAPLHWSSK